LIKVSVIIPSYGRPHLLKRAIKSVLDQTFQNFEIIVIDDNDPGEYKNKTKKIIESFNDKGIRYIPHKKNKGNNAARNTGLNYANGEYIAFLDNDDVFLPKKLEEHVSILDKSDNDVVLTYAQHLGLDEKNDYETISPIEKEAKSGYIYGDMLKRYFKKGILFQNWDAVIRKKIIEDLKFDYKGGVDDFVLMAVIKIFIF